MKVLTSREVDITKYPWVYGRDTFDDGTVIPWMKFTDDKEVGCDVHFHEGRWQVRPNHLHKS